MRVLHTADWHLDDRIGQRRLSRTEDLRRAVERIASYCEQETVDVLLIAGDLFSGAIPADEFCATIRHLQDVFRPFLSGGGTVLALTGNHDRETVCETLQHTLALAAPVETRPGALVPNGRFYLATRSTFYKLRDRSGQVAQFVLMPYPTSSRYLDDQVASWTSREERLALLRDGFARSLSRIKAHPEFDPRLPTVHAAHIYLEGTALNGLFRLSPQHDVAFGQGDVETGWAYVALGHIHQPQSLLGLKHVRYSGSIERLDMGEREDAKGVVLVEVGPEGLRGEPAILPLDATPFLDVTIDNPSEDLPRLRALHPDAGRALVRCRLTYTAGTDDLEAVLRAIDDLFPRWYDRVVVEAGALGPAGPDSVAVTTTQDFHESVTDYVNRNTEAHPYAADIRASALALLSEEQP